MFEERGRFEITTNGLRDWFVHPLSTVVSIWLTFTKSFVCLVLHRPYKRLHYLFEESGRFEITTNGLRDWFVHPLSTVISIWLTFTKSFVCLILHRPNKRLHYLFEESGRFEITTNGLQDWFVHPLSTVDMYILCRCNWVGKEKKKRWKISVGKISFLVEIRLIPPENRQYLRRDK